MIYLGDLSRADVRVLTWAARKAVNILEFGVGASTQVLCQVCMSHAQIRSVDTSVEWIKAVNEILNEMGIDRDISFHRYNDFVANDKYDLIFVDGYKTQREEFAQDIWPHLEKHGGRMLIHDSRKKMAGRIVSALVTKYQNEIKNIEISKDNSNMIAITKRLKLKYRNWNIDEKKEEWMYCGTKPRPDNWKEILKIKFDNITQ